ncbi:MAG: Do family serine endopeptidase, partial [Vicinamibacterales bacterium]
MSTRIDMGNTVAPARAGGWRQGAFLGAVGMLIGVSAFGAGAVAVRTEPGPAALATASHSIDTAPAGETSQPAGAARFDGRESYADLVARVAPSVVTIRSVHLVHQTSQAMPFADDPLFRRFFGDPDQHPRSDRRVGGLGSGVVVNDRGYILTNHHVVADAQDVTVELSDRRTLSAKVVGSDQPSDLAVLKIDEQGLPALRLADSDTARVGDVVLAFGNPLGVGQTVTMGIVSAKGRSTGLGDGSFEDFIQTDAAINQGNSGGALVNMRGELLGVNSQILSPSGGNIGIGFAIPANLAQGVMTQLIDHGKVRRGLLGVTVQNVTSDMATNLGLSQVRGAIVSSVTADGPAARAGLKQGDVILALNGHAVGDSNSLRNAIGGTEPGSSVSIVASRDGKEHEFRATLDELKPAKARRGDDSDDDDEDGQAPARTGRFGMTLDAVTPGVARRLGLDADTGVLVREIDPDGAAAQSGLARGDVILEVNRTKVSSPDAVRQQLEKATAERPTLLLVQRGQATIY